MTTLAVATFAEPETYAQQLDAKVRANDVLCTACVSSIIDRLPLPVLSRAK